MVATREGRVGRGALSRGPCLLRSFSEAKDQHLVAGSSGPTEGDSAWSRESAPLPTRPVNGPSAKT
jgi:hypothetical protein